MTDFTEKTIRSQSIFKGKIIELCVDEVELPNGKLATRELIKHPGAVAVIAVTDEGKLVLVKQFRKPLERALFEIPAGKLDPGEDPKACALRELKEETGYTCRDIEHVVSFGTSPGFADEVLHIYYTDTLISGERHLDEDEFLDNYEVTLEEALKLMKTEAIFDAKTVFAVQFLQMKQGQSSK
ncbi:NUDIX domain-containing protein [Tuberibacillus calidus]|uniref:NUDIX domain-containing protein n=1 Tax=Tuberibacillus calidus TaxID=340097 RepID=UPI000481D14D|nr:NUDIX hydrolase [Tuberibacillus calidus]